MVDDIQEFWFTLKSIRSAVTMVMPDVVQVFTWPSDPSSVTCSPFPAGGANV